MVIVALVFKINVIMLSIVNANSSAVNSDALILVHDCFTGIFQ